MDRDVSMLRVKIYVSNLSPEFPMETTYEVFISKIVCTQFLLLWSYAVKQSTDY